MFEAIARLTIRDGQLEGFKQQADEIVRLMGATDDPPIRYDWFLSDDGTQCEVHEAYANADSLLQHQRPIKDAKMKLMREFVDGHAMTIYGDPSPALLETMRAMGTPLTQFSVFRGLNAEIPALDEVPA